MSRQVVILHGWSDTSESFDQLARFLQRNGYRTVPIFLGDYISLRDDLTIDDVVKRMEQVIREHLDLPAGNRRRLEAPFHLVVHSTGGLVARRWISRYYQDRSCPVANLLMLAPANFGSRLAHLGRSMLARIFKGWRTGFETGEEMLYALELSSPFQWDLAQDDVFARRPGSPVLYAPDRTRPFVIVGTHPYEALMNQLTNEDGSDGTVRVAAANLNTYGRTVDFTGGPERLESPEITEWPRRGGATARFPLAVLPDRDHGTVKAPDEPGYAKAPEDQRRLGQLILQALAVRTPNQYAKVLTDWEAITAETRTFAGTTKEAQDHRDAYFRANGTPAEFFHEYYQVNVRAVDEFGDPIGDYFLAFMPEWKKKSWFGLKQDLPPEGVFFHDEVLEDVHRHRRQPADLALFIDRYDMMRRGGFYDRITASKKEQLAFTVTAADPGPRVSYFTSKASSRRGLIKLHDREDALDRWLKRHSTHFLELIIPRIAVDDAFKLRRA